MVVVACEQGNLNKVEKKLYNSKMEDEESSEIAENIKKQ